MVKVLIKADEDRCYQEPSCEYSIKLDARPMIDDRIEIDGKHSIYYYRVKNISFNRHGKIVCGVELIYKKQKK